MYDLITTIIYMTMMIASAWAFLRGRVANAIFYGVWMIHALMVLGV